MLLQPRDALLDICMNIKKSHYNRLTLSGKTDLSCNEALNPKWKLYILKCSDNIVLTNTVSIPVSSIGYKTLVLQEP